MESGFKSFFSRDRDRERLNSRISRLKPRTWRIFQSGNTKIPKQKIDDQEVKSERILRRPRSIAYTQVDDSGHRISQDPARKMRESHHILQESTGNHWNMEAVFRPENFRIFSGGFLPTSCAFQQEAGGKHWKKSEKFPAGILLPQNHRNYPKPAVSGPDCTTWVHPTRSAKFRKSHNTLKLFYPSV